MKSYSFVNMKRVFKYYFILVGFSFSRETCACNDILIKGVDKLSLGGWEPLLMVSEFEELGQFSSCGAMTSENKIICSAYSENGPALEQFYECESLERNKAV